MLKLLKYFFVFTAAVALFVSCKDFSFSSYVRGDAIAAVGNAKLYWEDVETIFTPGMDPEDSVKLLNSYIELWAKQQLKIQLAENAFPEDEERITRMVDDYRNSLLIHEYEKQYMNQRLDTLITTKEINDYYADNSGEFRISSPMVKAIVIKFPTGFRQEAQMRELARTNNPERLQDLVDIAIKNDFEYKEFTNWTDISEVTAMMPRLSENDNIKLQSTTTLFEATQSGTRYFLLITKLLKEGSQMPIEMAQSTIKTMIVNRRRQELLKTLEDSIYNAAVSAGDITINTK